MGSATIFFWLQLPNVHQKYRTALAITGLVTFIATYHYFRIFNSWNDAFDVKFDYKAGNYAVSLTGAPFNDAYRYVDWVLTVPIGIGRFCFSFLASLALIRNVLRAGIVND